MNLLLNEMQNSRVHGRVLSITKWRSRVEWGPLPYYERTHPFITGDDASWFKILR